MDVGTYSMFIHAASCITSIHLNVGWLGRSPWCGWGDGIRLCIWFSTEVWGSYPGWNLFCWGLVLWHWLGWASWHGWKAGEEWVLISMGGTLQSPIGCPWTLVGSCYSLGDCVSRCMYRAYSCRVTCFRWWGRICGHRILRPSLSFSKTTEAFGMKVNVPDARSQDDSQALNLLDQHTRKVGDRYETGLPWGEEETMFPNN